jgi:parallel beta-helix repeat protein
MPYSSESQKRVSPFSTLYAICSSCLKKELTAYKVEKADTLFWLSEKYGIPLKELVKENKEIISEPDLIPIGIFIRIPLSALRKPFAFNKKRRYSAPEISYNRENNTIYVSGKGAIVTIPQIKKSLPGKSILEEQSGGEWLLKSNLLLKENTALFIGGAEVKWLKLLSGESGFVSIVSDSGNIFIEKTKVTSWDKEAEDFDKDIKDGRSFILLKGKGRMDIFASEIAYLGFPYREGERFGSVYGLSWKGADGKGALIGGSLVRSEVHHNYFGVYTYGAKAMLFRDNKIFSNYKYGLNYHDHSNNFLVEGNMSFKNGAHGVIFSQGNSQNIVRDNYLFDNKLHGLVFHQQSNNNLAENNVFLRNKNNIVIFDSYNNVLKGNKVTGSEKGIRINSGSSKNFILNNELSSNRKGIYIYDRADGNFIVDNKFKDNGEDIAIKNSSQNTVIGASK